MTPDMINLSEHYHWFYSTVAQSLAALIGISGVFVVFKIQSLANNLEKKYDAFINYLGRLTNVSGYESMTKEELFTSAAEAIEARNQKIAAEPEGDSLKYRRNEVTKLTARMDNIKNIEKFLRDLRNSFTLLVIYLFALLIVSLACLAMSNHLVVLHGEKVESGVLYGMLLGILLLVIFCVVSLRFTGED